MIQHNPIQDQLSERTGRLQLADTKLQGDLVRKMNKLLISIVGN